MIISSAFNRKPISKLSSFSITNLPKIYNGTGKIRFRVTNNNLHHGVYIIGLSVVKQTFGHLFTVNNCQQFVVKSQDPKIHLVEYSNLLTVFDFTVEHLSE